MSQEPLESLEKDLRRAAAGADFAEVERLVLLYSKAAEKQVRSLPAGDRAMPVLAAQIDAVLEWTRLMLHTARAFKADELSRLSSLNGYLQSQAATAPATGLDA